MKNIFKKKLNVVKDEIIPIFFASDNNYLPYLSVALRSLIDNASKDYKYIIYILNSGVDSDKAQKILNMQNENFEIQFTDVSEKIKPLIKSFDMEDTLFYISMATYYRLLIANLFKQYKKALYLDCDIVVLDDISKFYHTDIGNNILGACYCQVVARDPILREYAKKIVGVDYTHYFNAGVLVMNLEQYRKDKIESKFIELLKKNCCEFIANDQDYLNMLCKGKVKMLDIVWNKMSIRDGYRKKPNLIHYAFFKKPWTDYDVKFDKYFWEYAKKVDFYDFIFNHRKNYDPQKRISCMLSSQNLIKRAKLLTDAKDAKTKSLKEKLVEKNEKNFSLKENEESIFNINGSLMNEHSTIIAR
jgi:lipopolysaccharide biosynthesis glycosyltransferase